MNGKTAFHRLDLDDQPPLGRDVHTITAIKPNVFMGDRQCDLSAVLNAGLRQLESRAFLISRFKKSRPKIAMHLDGQPDHPLGQLVLDQLTAGNLQRESSIDPLCSPWLRGK